MRAELTAIGGTARGPRLAWRGSSALSDALALFVSLRLVFGLFALYLWWGGSLPGPCHFELARNGWTAIPPLADSGAAFPLVGVWQRWDACWYTKIATYGYVGGDTNSVAFWPLFPAAIAPLGAVLGNAMALAGLVVSGVAYVAAMVGLERLVTRDFDRETAVRTVVFISIFPTAFFFFAPFTESLFLALAVWCIVAARERRWWLALVVGFLAALTRVQGLFLALPIAWEAFTWFRSERPWQAPAGSRGAAGPRPGRPADRRRGRAGGRIPRLSWPTPASWSANRRSTPRTRGAAGTSIRPGRSRTRRGRGPSITTIRCRR